MIFLKSKWQRCSCYEPTITFLSHAKSRLLGSTKFRKVFIKTFILSDANNLAETKLVFIPPNLGFTSSLASFLQFKYSVIQWLAEITFHLLLSCLFSVLFKECSVKIWILQTSRPSNLLSSHISGREYARGAAEKRQVWYLI